jgi:hypothetical protein
MPNAISPPSCKRFDPARKSSSRDAQPVAVIRAAGPVRRTISECIALAEAHEKETGQAPVLDADFAADVEEIIRNRKPWNPPSWE